MEENKSVMPKYNYRGIFFDGRMLGRAMEGLLADVPKDWVKTENPHITTSIQHSAKAEYKDIGGQCTVMVTGIAYDPERGLALLTEFKDGPKGAQNEFEATKQERSTHITIAMAPGHKPKEAADICKDAQFVKMLDEPIEIKGSFGGWTKEGTLDILSPDEKQWEEMARETLTAEDCNPYASGLLNAIAKDPGDKTIYLKSILDSRREGQGMGSAYDSHYSDKEVLDEIAHADYEEVTKQALQDKTIREGQRAFSINVEIPATQGVIKLADIPNDAIVYAVDSHGNGSLEFGMAEVGRQDAKTTSLISYTNDKGDCTFVPTFFPGDLMPAADLHNHDIVAGQRFTKEEAIAIAGSNVPVKDVSIELIKEYENSTLSQNGLDESEYESSTIEDMINEATNEELVENDNLPMGNESIVQGAEDKEEGDDAR